MYCTVENYCVRQKRFPISVLVAVELSHSVREGALLPVQQVLQRVVRIFEPKSRNFFQFQNISESKDISKLRGFWDFIWHIFKIVRFPTFFFLFAIWTSSALNSELKSYSYNLLPTQLIWKLFFGHISNKTYKNTLQWRNLKFFFLCHE